MLVPDLFLYAALAAWCVFWFLFDNIKAKIGGLIFPLAILFGGFVFSLKTSEKGALTVGDMIDKFNSIDWTSVNWVGYLMLLPPLLGLIVVIKLMKG
ncbi:hypothetical protein GXG07_22380 [Escherichia coli]|nr:hypothetical protein [Escherichia coli]